MRQLVPNLVNMVPAESYERDTVMNIYDGRMHTEFVADQTNVKSRGKYHKLEKHMPSWTPPTLASTKSSWG